METGTVKLNNNNYCLAQEHNIAIVNKAQTKNPLDLEANSSSMRSKQHLQDKNDKNRSLKT